MLAIDYGGNWYTARRPHKSVDYQVGQDIEVSITLVTTDSKTLSCASQEVVANRHCEFDGKKQRWTYPPDQRPGPQEVLAPYKTTDDQLFLIPGLFTEPTLKRRLEVDPPTTNGEHARFVANCKLHIEGKVSRMFTRWHTNGDWGEANNGWVGTVSGCTLSDA